jgi:hypothetical protein
MEICHREGSTGRTDGNMQDIATCQREGAGLAAVQNFTKNYTRRKRLRQPHEDSRQLHEHPGS